MNKVQNDKLKLLRNIFTAMGSCVIGFSGGVDSSLLFAVAADVLHESAVAVTATSKTYPDRELVAARELAARLCGRHIIIESEELDIPEFATNPSNRCYYCKKELFTKLRMIADREQIKYIVDGTNVDDSSDHRPGRKAADELQVRSPLVEAGFTKQDIRDVSREIGLENWDKPAFACLSSRFPYGTSITEQRVEQVGKAEQSLHAIGLRVFRVRYHDTVARVELGEAEFKLAVGPLRHEIVRLVKNAGFTYVALDLQGYRTGAMNEVI